MTRSRDLLLAAATAVLTANGGLAHVRRFDEAGIARHEVAHLRHLGALERPRIGWYLEPAAPEEAHRAVCCGGILGCVSAAASYGIAVPPRSKRPVHVALESDQTRLRRSTDSTTRAPAGTDTAVRLHWHPRHDPDRGWRVSPLDALLQMAHCVPFDWLVAAIDSARNGTTRQPLLADADLPRLRAALPAHLRRAADQSDPRADLSGETLIRLGLLRRGIPCRPQAELLGVYWTDLYVDEWLPVESDGLANHAGDQVVRDRNRDATLAGYGHPPLRFLQKAIESDLDGVIDTIERVWRRGRPRT